MHREYATAREEIIHAQAEQLLELSTPVVKLWDGVVAVPLVGTLDSARTQVVMENLLQALVDTGPLGLAAVLLGFPEVDIARQLETCAVGAEEPVEVETALIAEVRVRKKIDDIEYKLRSDPAIIKARENVEALDENRDRVRQSVEDDPFIRALN